ncbi:MAG: type II toxin-antitoxin system RelE/ParE family toxin [Desulfobulbus sp.]
MAGYEILFKESVYKDLKHIPKTDLKRILARIEQLGLDPRQPGSQKLTGAELYRVRQGNYRIVYTIEDDKLIVCVVKVGHRKEVYRQE